MPLVPLVPLVAGWASSTRFVVALYFSLSLSRDSDFETFDAPWCERDSETLSVPLEHRPVLSRGSACVSVEQRLVSPFLRETCTQILVPCGLLQLSCLGFVLVSISLIR